MKTWLKKWHHKSFNDAVFHLQQKGQWGVNVETLEHIALSIEKLLPESIDNRTLRETSVRLWTTTIDHLIFDLGSILSTFEKSESGERGYALERVSNYPLRTYAPAFIYLRTTHNHGIRPKDAWPVFHKAAMEAVIGLELIRSEDDPYHEHAYFQRRYRMLLEDVSSVYQLFGLFSGLTVPALL